MRQLTWILAISFAAVLTAVPIEKKDVEYGRPGGHPLLLDLYVPDGPGPLPAAILVHGGGFDGGSKSTNVKPLFDGGGHGMGGWKAPEMQHWKVEMVTSLKKTLKTP
jgi:hypothetical protein